MRAMVPSPPTTRTDWVLAKSGSGSCEQLGIELVGLAIDVEIGARKARRDQRRAELGHAGENSSSTKQSSDLRSVMRIEPRTEPGTARG